MSEIAPTPSHQDHPLKQHKKKKRSRDETQDGGDDLDNEAKMKKKRKHGEESADNLSPSTLPAVSDVQGAAVTEVKRKKEKRKHASGSMVDTNEKDQGDVSAVEAHSEKKKAKRDRGAEAPEASAEPSEEVATTKERKKKKRKHQMVDGEGGQEIETAINSASALPTDSTVPPVKKKKKSKDKVPPSSNPAPTALPPSLVPAATESSHLPPDNSSMFPPPNYGSYPPYFPGAQPNMPLFPTVNDPSFSDLNFGSNEDVLRALQDLDVSKIAGVLKALSDAADAANIPLTGLPTSSSLVRPAPPVPSSVSGGSERIPRQEGIPKKSKQRRAPDVTLPSSSSNPETRSGHELLLATKWMGPSKLAELVKSEGLEYKKGKFSVVETKQINEALEKYRTTRGLTEEDMNSIIFPRDDKHKDTSFWSEITSALSRRPIIAVYHYVRRARHPLKQQGKWRPEEDARLIQAITSLGQQWEKVAPLVGRMATDCRDRYRNHIVDREKRNSGVWSAAEEDELTRIVTKMQKGKDLDSEVFWGKVTDLMGGTRSRQQCRIKWTDSLSKKYKSEGQLPRWSAQDAFTLIHKIDSLNIRDDTEIPWKSLLDPQWNLWSTHVLQRRWLTMKRSIKGFEHMTHSEIMDILRVKNAEVPHVKVIKSAKFVVDSDDDEAQPGSSTGPGTLAGKGSENEDDSE